MMDVFSILYEKKIPIVKGKNLGEVLDDISSYCFLTDDILYDVLKMNPVNADVKQAQDIINRILCRDLYLRIGSTYPQPGQRRQRTFKETLLVQLKEDYDTKDLIVITVKINFGNGCNSPLDKVRFVRKESPNKAFKISENELSCLCPKNFCEISYHVYCKSKDAVTKDRILSAFLKTCKLCNCEFKLGKMAELAARAIREGEETEL